MLMLQRLRNFSNLVFFMIRFLHVSSSQMLLMAFYLANNMLNVPIYFPPLFDLMILILLPIFNLAKFLKLLECLQWLDTHDCLAFVIYKGYEVFGSFNGFDIERPTHVNAHKIKGSICSLFTRFGNCFLDCSL